MSKSNGTRATLPEKAFIAIGSNIHPERYIPEAVQRLRSLGRLIAVSPAYKTKPVGPLGQPDYHNAAVAIETDTPPLKLRDQLRRIEADLGRVRTGDKCAPRTIDLDLVHYVGVVLNSPELTLPSPDIRQQRHVLIPLLAITRSGDLPGLENPPTMGNDIQEAFCIRLDPPV